MFLYNVDTRLASAIRLAGLVLVSLSVLSARHGPAVQGRGLVATVLFALAVAGWLAWLVRPGRRYGVSPELAVMALAGGGLTGTVPGSAASAFVFVAVVAAGLRSPLERAGFVAVAGAAAVAISTLVYDGSALGVLAYALGFAASALAASNSRQSVERADQAELLLAQTQRSHEERLRAARLEESTRIAREIHDVLAHALAGLTIQLEATASLLETGADRESVLARVRRAHELAREGVRETRRAIGALRGETLVGAVEAVRALVTEYDAVGEGRASLELSGDEARLRGDAGQTVVRVVQEALTNARKHAPGASVSVIVSAGEEVVAAVVCDRGGRPEDRSEGGGSGVDGELARTGGGYGLRGMRERAEILGGSLFAGPDGAGWRVELRLPGVAR